MIIIALILITSITVLTASEKISKDILEDKINENLVSIAQSRAGHIETILKEHKHFTEAIAVGNAFTDLFDESIDYTQRIEQAERRIKNTIESRSEINAILILDKDGKVVASNLLSAGEDKSTDIMFIEGKKGIFIGDIKICKHNGKIIIGLAAPIYVNDEFAGLCIISFFVENELFTITTDRTGLGETGEIYIINKDGYMITPSRFADDAVFKLKVDTENSRNCIKHIKMNMKYHESKTEIFNNYMGTNVLGVHIHLKDMEWCLLVEISEKEAFAPIVEMHRIMTLPFALFLIFGVAISIILSRTMTKPITELRDTSVEIGKGNFDVKAKIRSDNEIGEPRTNFLSLKRRKVRN